MNKNMDKTSTNFNKLLQSFRDKWVAVSDDYGKVFASGNTLESITNKVKDMTGVKMFRVIPFDTIYSPKS
ncbi:MAG: hypothetical protein AAB629_01145 [Patescibacteria group bacterium]